jgi:hypothetical protein
LLRLPSRFGSVPPLPAEGSAVMLGIGASVAEVFPSAVCVLLFLTTIAGDAGEVSGTLFSATTVSAGFDAATSVVALLWWSFAASGAEDAFVVSVGFADLVDLAPTAEAGTSETGLV